MTDVNPGAGGMTAGERAFTAWAGSSKADATPLMWTWDEMPESQRVRWENIARASSPVAPAGEDGAGTMAEREARVMQEWRWGNLTRLGVANALRRDGFKLEIAVEKSNALPAHPAEPAAPDVIAGLADPNTVHINMLRGGIAKPTPTQIGHLYRGEDAVEVVAEVMRQNPDAFAAPDGALGSSADADTHRAADKAVIDHMVQRFLWWRLPEDFNPDDGISFTPTFNDHAPGGPQKRNPVGTNLFTAVQAEAMVRHMLEGLPK